MNEEQKSVLTKEGKEELEKQLENLITVARPQVVNEIKLARAQGDLSENADYDAARAKQAEIEGQIAKIEAMLENCVIIETDGKKKNFVTLGSTVKVLDLSENEESVYTIVGSVESDPLNGKISNICALGKALIDKKVGETVIVQVEEPYKVKIIALL